MMIEEAMKVLREWGCDVAYLCANIEESGSLYLRAGFGKSHILTMADQESCMRRQMVWSPR
jgi:hypothetical protein